MREMEIGSRKGEGCDAVEVRWDCVAINSEKGEEGRLYKRWLRYKIWLVECLFEYWVLVYIIYYLWIGGELVWICFFWRLVLLVLGLAWLALFFWPY